MPIKVASLILQSWGNNSYQIATGINWLDDHQERLNLLVDCVTSPALMAFPDISKPFVLHTDTILPGTGGEVESYRLYIKDPNSSGEKLSLACGKTGVSGY